MNITFVYPDVEGIQYYGTKKFYHGIGYLSSVLRAKGHKTSLLYLQATPTKEDFLSQLQESSPDVVAFSSTTHQHPFVEACADWIKSSAPELVVVSGGTHPTLATETVSTNRNIDVTCQGEGEYALAELVDRLGRGEAYTDIANLWVRKGDRLFRNPMAPLVEDLERFPFADRELFDYADILRANGGWVDMMAGRGCPYQCSYCAVPALQKQYRPLGKYVRYRAVEDVIAEIEYLVNTFDVQTLNFQDDVFTLKHDWTIAFCEAYASRFKHIPFWINTRVERVNYEDVVIALSRAGCQGVRVGLESGDEELRRDILKRKMTNSFIKDTLDLFKSHGMETYTCNMLGLPGETADMIQETVDFNRELAPTQLQFSVFYPYPLTELHEVAVREGYYEEGRVHTTYFDDKSELSMPQLSQKEITEGFGKFRELRNELALKRRSPFKHRLYTILRRYVYRNHVILLRKHINALGAFRARVRTLLKRQNPTNRPPEQAEHLFPTGG